MQEYDPEKIEKKWRDVWHKNETYKTRENSEKEKFFVLDMFPYPSGEGLHVGHPKGYIATDIFSRYKRMSGFEVLHPMGWDAFGLPAENYALKNKVHPRIAVEKNVTRFKNQLELMGFDYDWSREINTSDPNYYKWTQWIFLQMWKNGLAYESNEPINWCLSCQTGLANEDLERGKCERCGSMVEKKRIRQWVLAITKYADRLLEDLNLLTEWPENIKEQQRQWIGKSEGLIFEHAVEGLKIKLKTFSAHFEASYADTFIAIAPDHDLLDNLIEGTSEENSVRSKIEEINIKRLENKHGDGEVEGVFTGRYAIDPLSGNKMPIWVASFVIANYGTGIVRCSAFDKRDLSFAEKYNIPLKNDKGYLAGIDKLSPEELRNVMAKHFIKNNWAEPGVMYRLQDWVFSRQRYWGEPIPLIHCQGKCGIVAVPEKDLPVRLPVVEHYEPTGTGESPLANISEWVNVKCPKCGGLGKRETNTMPQWAGSSWYYLAFAMGGMSNLQFEDNKIKEEIQYWMSVDLYVGGAEHATRHLIYARFWYKFLYDQKIVSTLEPFTRLKSVGLILASDGRKMSKRWGNVINPDDVITRFGADTFRIYEMFLGPFSDSVTWNDDAIVGPRRFLERVWRLQEKASVNLTAGSVQKNDQQKTYAQKLSKAINSISSDIENFKFNTAVSTLMILASAMEEASSLSKDDYLIFIRLLAPFAPHITEEIWHNFSNDINGRSIHVSAWPKISEIAIKKTGEQVIALPVQVDGKVRDIVFVLPGATKKEVEELALKSTKIIKWLGDRSLSNIKITYIKSRVFNFHN